MSEYTMVYALLDADAQFEKSFHSTHTVGWNLNLEGALAFLTDHPDARFVIGVRE